MCFPCFLKICVWIYASMILIVLYSKHILHKTWFTRTMNIFEFFMCLKYVCLLKVVEYNYFDLLNFHRISYNAKYVISMFLEIMYLNICLNDIWLFNIQSTFCIISSSHERSKDHSNFIQKLSKSNHISSIWKIQWYSNDNNHLP